MIFFFFFIMYLPGLKFIVAFKTFFFLARIFRIKFQWLTCSCCTPSINFCLPHHLLVRCYSWNCDKASSSIGTIPIFFILRFNAWGTLAICRSRGLAPAGNRGWLATDQDAMLLCSKAILNEKATRVASQRWKRSKWRYVYWRLW